MKNNYNNAKINETFKQIGSIAKKYRK